MSARIVLFGATGYTGARTAEALVARGARPVLAGRDPARLARWPTGSVAWRPPVPTSPTHARVRGLLGHGDVLVTTVGPFLRLGRAAVDAASTPGAVYLDSTGEPPFVRRVFEHDAARAAATGAALVPGLRAGLRAGQPRRRARAGRGGRAGAPPGRRLRIDGASGQAFSRGTLVSLVGVLFEPGFAFTRRPAGATRSRAGGCGGSRRAAGRAAGLSVGGSEHLTLPGLAPTLREIGVAPGLVRPADAGRRTGWRR